jgi:hypothetical protein
MGCCIFTIFNHKYSFQIFLKQVSFTAARSRVAFLLQITIKQPAFNISIKEGSQFYTCKQAVVLGS